MRRLVHSRAWIALLVLLLQVAVLPGQARLRCMLKAGSLDCCCATEAELCAGTACCGCSDLPSARDDDTDDVCHCGDGATSLVAVEAKGDGSSMSIVLVVGVVRSALIARVWACAGFVPYVEPVARTGPPLHVTLGVFLI